MTHFIVGSGVLCSVGIGITQVAASVRTGLSGIATSAIFNRDFAPIRMALMPEPVLGALVSEVETQTLTARCRRLLRLAAPALLQASSFTPDLSRTPLLLALPEALPSALRPETQRWPLLSGGNFLQLLATQSRLQFAHNHSQVFPLGRAGALVALEHAMALLTSRQAETVIVGGVDTYLDLGLLALLDQERRLLGEQVMDGFIPGEGAAFVVLATAPLAKDMRSAPAVIATAAARDPGHRYGNAPALGEGLSNAMEVLRGRLSSNTMPFRCTWAGFNGENLGAKEWGVAQLRHRDLFDQDMQLEHPADCYGDLGAATGAMLLALAAHTVRMGTRPDPMLVWASSDQEPVACTCVARIHRI